MRFLLKHPDKKTKAWAEKLLDRSQRMFSAWHRRGEMSEAGFHRSMITHRDRFLEIVRKPPDSNEADNLAARFAVVAFQCEDSDEVQSYALSDDYFRFMFAEEVEPTNNHAEQQIRHCVIDRRPFHQETWAKARAANVASVITNGCGPPLPPATSRAAASFTSCTNQLKPSSTDFRRPL